jgi:hypothetical protein
LIEENLMERIKLIALLGALGIAGTVACTATIGTPGGPIVDNSSSSGATGDGGASSSGNTGDSSVSSSSSSGSTSSSSGAADSGAADSGPKDCPKQAVSFGTSATEVACGKCVNNACCAEFSACFATADSPCSKAFAKITSDQNGGCAGVPDNEYDQCVTDQKVVFCMADMACSKAVDDAVGCQDKAIGTAATCGMTCGTN